MGDLFVVRCMGELKPLVHFLCAVSDLGLLWFCMAVQVCARKFPFFFLPELDLVFEVPQHPMLCSYICHV